MRTLLLALLLFVISSSAIAGEAYDRVMKNNEIRCGYFTWPPYILKDANTGKLSGINYDYMREIGKILDLKINWVEETSAGSAITGLNTGRYDVMCATLWPDAARLKNAQITLPTFYSTVYAVARAQDKRFDNAKSKINDENTKIIGIEGDITYSIGKKYPKATMVGLPQMSDSAQLMQSIVSKKADVTFIDKGTVADFNKTNNNTIKVIEGLPPVQVFPEALAVKAGEVRLAELLNHAIRMITDTGDAKRFVAKYPEYGYYAPKPYWEKPE